MIKRRETFNPTAPAVIKERAAIFFKDIIDSPYMTQTFRVEALAYKHIPAAIHKDGTARVQTVTRQLNKHFYDLISEIGEKNGTPVVLNTSFNAKGEPIVETVVRPAMSRTMPRVLTLLIRFLSWIFNTR